MFEAWRALPPALPATLSVIGASLDPALGDAARALAQADPRVRVLGARPHGWTRQAIKRAHLLLVPSRMEGGANVVVEAVTSGTPVLGSRISGNVGMLGSDYPGWFDVGDASGLAALVRRAHGDRASWPSWRRPARAARRASRRRPRPPRCMPRSSSARAAANQRAGRMSDPASPAVGAPSRTRSSADSLQESHERTRSAPRCGSPRSATAAAAAARSHRRCCRRSSPSPAPACCRRSCWSASRPPTTPRSGRSTSTRRSSRRRISSCPSSTIRSTSAPSPRPTPSPTSTRWAARRCSRWRWSACRSTSCRWRPSAGFSRAASRSAQRRASRSPAATPSIRSSRSTGWSRSASSTRSTSSATRAHSQATCWCWASRSASASTARR